MNIKDIVIDSWRSATTSTRGTIWNNEASIQRWMREFAARMKYRRDTIPEITLL